MRHFQPKIDCARCVRQRADGNVINACGCDPPDVFQCDAPAGFKLDVVSPQRQGFPNLSRHHVVETNDVDAVDLDERSRLLQIISLHFDPDVGPFLAKLTNLIGKPGKPSESGQMIVLYEDHVVQTGTVVNATTSRNRSLFQYANPRGRLAGIKYFGRMIADCVDKLPGKSCHAAQALKKI